MTRYSHLWLGFVAGVRIVGFQHYAPEQVIALGSFIVGNISPDIDVKLFGMSNKRFNERNMFSHRGILHHIFLPLFLFLFSFLFSQGASFAIKWFALGYALHLFADMFSMTGIPYGLRYQDRVRVKLYITGTATEAFTTILFTALIALSWIVYPRPAYAENNSNMKSYVSSDYQKYLSIKKDNKTLEKYKNLYSLDKLKKDQKHAWKSAEKSYEYYKKNVRPNQQKDIEMFLHSQGIKYSSLLNKDNSIKQQILGKNDYLYIFMSSSVPFSVWHNYATAIDKLRREGQGNIGIIMRGCIGGCKKVMPTMRFIRRVLTIYGEKLSVPILIDPLLFRLYKIKKVPTFIYAKNVQRKNITISSGLSMNLKGKDITAYRLVGDCGLNYALKEIYYKSSDEKMLKLYNLLNQSWFEKK